MSEYLGIMHDYMPVDVEVLRRQREHEELQNEMSSWVDNDQVDVAHVRNMNTQSSDAESDSESESVESDKSSESEQQPFIIDPEMQRLAQQVSELMEHDNQQIDDEKTHSAKLRLQESQQQVNEEAQDAQHPDDERRLQSEALTIIQSAYNELFQYFFFLLDIHISPLEKRGDAKASKIIEEFNVQFKKAIDVTKYDDDAIRNMQDKLQTCNWICNDWFKEACARVKDLGATELLHAIETTDNLLKLFLHTIKNYPSKITIADDTLAPALM